MKRQERCKFASSLQVFNLDFKIATLEVGQLHQPVAFVSTISLFLKAFKSFYHYIKNFKILSEIDCYATE